MKNKNLKAISFRGKSLATTLMKVVEWLNSTVEGDIYRRYYSQFFMDMVCQYDEEWSEYIITVYYEEPNP
ncbi:MAG TPA: hypothetical protein VIY48_09575 [Candidatus Paceibacterota bacterium]